MLPSGAVVAMRLRLGCLSQHRDARGGRARVGPQGGDDGSGIRE